MTNKINQNNKKERQKEYMDEYNKEYYQNNKDKIKTRAKEWYQNNKDKIKVKKKEYMKKYYQKPDVKIRVNKHNQKPEVKARRKEYSQQPKVKAKKKEYMGEYSQRPEVKTKQKEYKIEYTQRPEVKERRRKYTQRPEVKAKAKEYTQRPDIKLRRKEHGKQHNQKPEIRAKIFNKFCPDCGKRMHNTATKCQACYLREVVGENHPMWKGGLSFEPYGLDFNKKLKQKVKERDGRCMLCNVNLEDLKLLKRRVHIHHIDYCKTNNFPQNLVTLCINCHMVTNNNRNHWTTFLQSLLSEQYDYQYSQDQKIILDFTKENLIS